MHGYTALVDKKIIKVFSCFNEKCLVSPTLVVVKNYLNFTFA